MKHYKGFRLYPFSNHEKGDDIILVDDALDLINRQRAEIERLKAGKQSIKELADELCNRIGEIGETGITDYNTYLCVAGLIQKVMGAPCTDGADCFAAEGKE